jgi:hypothetical protein
VQDVSRPFDLLPDELLLHILSFIEGPRRIDQAGLVDRRWAANIDAADFFRSFLGEKGDAQQAAYFVEDMVDAGMKDHMSKIVSLLQKPVSERKIDDLLTAGLLDSTTLSDLPPHIPPILLDDRSIRGMARRFVEAKDIGEFLCHPVAAAIPFLMTWKPIDTEQDAPTAERITKMLRAGFDPQGATAGGPIPLVRAVSSGLLQTARVLLNAGADVNVRHVQGLTPLMQALVWHCEIDIVGTLLAAKADVHAVAGEGETVLGFALNRHSPLWERAAERSQKITGAIRALLAAGLKITNPAEGRQAIAFARSAQQEDLVDLLIDAGARKP